MIVYTDGACSGNPGPGGFGIAVYSDEGTFIESYAARTKSNTTNNEQELLAILHALELYGHKLGDTTGEMAVVYSDSSYAVNTYNKWMFDWERRGWKKSDKKTPENLAIIQNYYKLYMDGWRIDLRKCDGHSGIEGNEMADNLATGKILPTKEL